MQCRAREQSRSACSFYERCLLGVMPSVATVAGIRDECSSRQGAWFVKSGSMNGAVLFLEQDVTAVSVARQVVRWMPLGVKIAV